MENKVDATQMAREAIIEFLDIPLGKALTLEDIADRLLAYLLIEGFQVVPLNGSTLCQ